MDAKAADSERRRRRQITTVEMVDQPAAGDRHRGKRHREQRPRQADLPAGGTSQVQKQAPADLVHADDEARAGVAHDDAEHAAVPPQHDPRRAAGAWCRDPVFGTASSTGTQASSDASAAATNSQRIPEMPTSAADERPDREPHRAGPEQRAVRAALLRRRPRPRPPWRCCATSTTPAPGTLQGPHEKRGNGRADEGKGGARHREGHKAAQLDGPAPDPVRQATDRVLHEDGRQEEGRHHHSDKGNRRAQLAKVERKERHHRSRLLPTRRRSRSTARRTHRFEAREPRRPRRSRWGDAHDRLSSRPQERPVRGLRGPAQAWPGARPTTHRDGREAPHAPRNADPRPSGARPSSSVNHRPSAASRMRLALAGERPSVTRACCQAAKRSRSGSSSSVSAATPAITAAPRRRSRLPSTSPDGPKVASRYARREGSGPTRPGAFAREILVEARAEPLHHGRDERGTCGEMVEDPALGDAGLARRGLEGEVGDAVAKNDLLRAEQDPFAGVLCSCH